MGWKENVAEAKSLMAQVRELNKEGADGASGIDSGEKATKARNMITEANRLAEQAKSEREDETKSTQLEALLKSFEDGTGHVGGEKEILEARKSVKSDDELVRPSTESYLAISKNMAESIYGKTAAAKLRPADTKVLTEGTDSAGGYLVVPEYHQELFAEVRRTGNALRTLGWVSLHPTNGKKLYIPKGSGSATVGWTSEDAPAPSQDQAYTQIGVDIFKLTGISKLSVELFEDGDPSAMDLAITELAKLTAIAEEQAWLYGTGSGQPKGILTSYNNGVITNSSNMDASYDTQQEQIDGVLDLASKVMTTYFAPATGVLVAPKRYAFWRKAKDTTGNYLFNAPGSFRAPGDFSSSQYNGGDILGLPIGISANIPTTLDGSGVLGNGTQDRIIVADWSEAHAFIRRDVTVDTNTTGDEAFDNDRVKVKIRMRQGFTAERQANAFAVGYGAGLV